LCGYAPIGEGNTSKAALSRMEKENPILFDKYLEFLAQRQKVC
jgi:hypothetical protein